MGQLGKSFQRDPPAGWRERESSHRERGINGIFPSPKQAREGWQCTGAAPRPRKNGKWKSTSLGSAALPAPSDEAKGSWRFPSLWNSPPAPSRPIPVIPAVPLPPGALRAAGALTRSHPTGRTSYSRSAPQPPSPAQGESAAGRAQLSPGAPGAAVSCEKHQTSGSGGTSSPPGNQGRGCWGCRGCRDVTCPRPRWWSGVG